MSKYKGICQTCGKNFETYLCGRKTVKFCSLKCIKRRSYRTGKVIICLNCHNSCYKSGWQVRKGTNFCSKTCQQLFQKYFRGVNAPHWKGDKIGYMGLHNWLRNNFIKNKCEKCTSTKSLQWSKLKGKGYERKRENFWVLCASCHKKYDLSVSAIRL